MDTPAQQALGLLKNAGVGVDTGITGWVLKLGRLTDAPNTVVALYDTGGLSDTSPLFLLDYVTIQARVRGAANDYPGAYQKARDVKDVLLGLPPQDIGTVHWTSVIMQGDITFMGYDQQNRPEFSVNFRVILEPQAGVSTLSHRESL